MFQCVLKPFLNSSFYFYMPNSRRKMMLIPKAYKIIIQTCAGFFSAIHFLRLSYLMEVCQMNGHPNHLGLCSLLFTSPKSYPDTSALFLPYTLLHILQHSVQKSLSPGSFFQFPHTAFSPFLCLSQLSSPTSTVCFYVI